jgi:hypothetical protein
MVLRSRASRSRIQLFIIASAYNLLNFDLHRITSGQPRWNDSGILSWAFGIVNKNVDNLKEAKKEETLRGPAELR